MHKRLTANLIPRNEPRTACQREEEREVGTVERAIVRYRGQDHLVAVVNISSRGTMIIWDIVPRIGESVLVQFQGCTRIHAFVRWVRDGRIGLNFGHEIRLA